ncbi:hypothetical protein J6590_042340 [Homalodisca vitripennis]|nr:hypothetical protein J6590_042340 [Homalodisca vitripennis]
MPFRIPVQRSKSVSADGGGGGGWRMPPSPRSGTYIPSRGGHWPQGMYVWPLKPYTQLTRTLQRRGRRRGRTGNAWGPRAPANPTGTLRVTSARQFTQTEIEKFPTDAWEPAFLPTIAPSVLSSWTKLSLETSQSIAKPRGVPQGTCLGPIWFNLFTADFRSCLNRLTGNWYAYDSQMHLHYDPAFVRISIFQVYSALENILSLFLVNGLKRLQFYISSWIVRTRTQSVADRVVRYEQSSRCRWLRVCVCRRGWQLMRKQLVGCTVTPSCLPSHPALVSNI